MLDASEQLLQVRSQEKIETYRLEAELQRQLPKFSFRHQAAVWLYTLAIALEPVPGYTLRKAQG